MTKKQIVITSVLISVAILALAGGVGTYLYFRNDTTTLSSTTQSSTTATLNPSDATTIPLGEKTTESSKSGLTVDDGASNSTNLGSGRTNTTTSSNNSGASAESFATYEQYKDKNEVFFGDIVEGNGAVAQKDAQLAVTYKGYLTNGQMFDQSRTGANGQLEPLLFQLGSGQLIPGFEQGVAGMKAGGSRRVIIPPSLGYGANAQNGIPANSVLVFDIQLLTVQ
jgi:FKBP-type peptidyl-prolyl cis-trans isomerase